MNLTQFLTVGAIVQDPKVSEMPLTIIKQDLHRYLTDYNILVLKLVIKIINPSKSNCFIPENGYLAAS